ncbi:MAG: DHA1 family tetracycline resistance protein-like MFS transporter [Flavobacteriaceae bacterium]|jgi:DHA1 family tetracycline resistance protein-like MFS transporter
MNKRLVPAYLLTLVNVLGFSILMPILPFVVEDYGAPKWVFGLLLTLYSAFQFFGAPYLGAMSDSRGRKPVLVISQIGTLFSWIVFVIALSLPEVPMWGMVLPLWIIIFSRIIDGITGGNTAVANAYVADITTRKEKGYIFGYLGGVAGIGFIIGPGIGGLAASTSWGYMGTMFFAIFISVITLITIIFWLKESHPVENRVPKQKQSILKSFLILKRIREINPEPIVKVLFVLKFFFSSMMAFYISTISLFLIDLFKFDVQHLGYFMFAGGSFLAINQAFVSHQFIKRLGEYRTLLLGLGLSSIGLIFLTLTDNLVAFIAFYYVLNLGLSLCFPTFTALIAIHANPKKQGEIMGISESIGSFTMALFPVLGALLYSIIGFELYWGLSLLPLIALIIALATYKRLGTAVLE